MIVQLLTDALTAATVIPIPLPDPPATTDGPGWAMLITAIGGVLAIYLTHIRNRAAQLERENTTRAEEMEKEIRRLRSYSWENAKRLQAQNAHLEDVIDNLESHIGDLEVQIWSGDPPPPKKLKRIPRPKDLELISDLSIAETEKQTKETLEEDKPDTSELPQITS